MELDKLALYRDTEPISSRMSGRSSPEALPGSIWAFVDAVGERETGPALGSWSACSADARSRSSSWSSIAASASCSSWAIGWPAARTSRPRPGRWASAASTAPACSRLRPASWTTAELADALDGLLELDATGEGRARDVGGRGTATAGVHALGDGPHRRAASGARPRREGQAGISRPRTRPVPGRRDRSRWRRRSGPRQDRAARSGRGRCRAGSSPRTGRRGCRSTAARSGRATERSCRTGS